MNYFKRFNDWNNKYKDLSVSAEQYTIIKNILKEADEEVRKQQIEISVIEKENDKNERISKKLIDYVSLKNQEYKFLLFKYRMIIVGITLIIIVYGSIVYFLFKQ